MNKFKKRCTDNNCKHRTVPRDNASMRTECGVVVTRDRRMDCDGSICTNMSIASMKAEYGVEERTENKFDR